MSIYVYQWLMVWLYRYDILILIILQTRIDMMKSACNDRIERIWIGLAMLCRTTSMSLCVKIQSDKDRKIASLELMPKIASMGLRMGLWSEKDHKEFVPRKIIRTWSKKDHNNLIRKRS